MKLDEIIAEPLTSNECFFQNGNQLNFSILDFWKWNQSDLIENRTRGILAEFIVMKALNIESKIRLEWDSYDLETTNNIKIEVKSAAYIQAWKQKEYSKIKFSIAPTRKILEDNNLSEKPERQADIYIFCLLKTKEQNLINPLDLNQWHFYLIATRKLDKEIPEQKSIGLAALEKISEAKCGFSDLEKEFRKLTSIL